MTEIFNNNTYFNNLSKVGQKKHLQKKKILYQMYEQKSLSIAELISKLNLSTPSILALLDELTKDDLIKIIGSGGSSGGRRPNLYGLSSNSFYVLAIDMGLYSTRMAIFNCNNENITGIKEYKSDIRDAKAESLEIFDFAQNLISNSGIQVDRLIGVGVDMPGLIDFKNGINYSYLTNPNRSLKNILEEKFDKPVFVLNDAQAKALAELRFGQAKSKKNTLVLNLSSGLGTGLILNGMVYHGTDGFSGEFSHTPYVDNGILCSCGKKGCLETVASGLALVRGAKEGIKEGATTLISEIVKGDLDSLRSHHIVEAVLRGDQFSIGLVSKMGYELGKGLSVLVQTLNPELIILGGRISNVGEFLTLPMLQALNEHTLFKIKESVKIKISQLKDNANLLGATAYVVENVLNNE